VTVGSIGDLRRAAHEAFGVEFAVNVVRILAVIGIHLAADGTLQPMVIALKGPHGVVFILMVGAIDGGLYLCAAGFTDAVGRNMPLLIAGDAAMDTRQPVIGVVMLPAGRIVRIINAVAVYALEHHAGLTAHAARSPILGVAHVGVVRVIVVRLADGTLMPASVFIPVPGVIIPGVVRIAFNAGGAALTASAGGAVQPVLSVVALLTTFCTDMPVVGAVMLPGVLPVIHKMGRTMDRDAGLAAIRANAGSVRTIGMMAALVDHCVTVLAGQPVHLGVVAPVLPVPIVVSLAFDAGRAALTASAGQAVQPVIADVNLITAGFADMPVAGGIMLPGFPVGDRVLHEIDNDVGCTAIAAGVIGHGAALEMRAVVEDLTTLAGKRMVGFVECPGAGAPVVTNFAFNAGGAALTASAGLAVQPVSPDIELFTAFIADTPVVGAIIRHVIPVVDGVLHFFSRVAGSAAETAQAIHAADVVIAVIDLLTTFIADMPVIDAVKFPGVLPVVHKMSHSTTDRDARLAAHFTGSFVSNAAVGGMVRLIDRFRAVNTFGPVAFLIVEERVEVIRMTFIDGHARLATLSADSFVSSITLGICSP